MVTWMDSDLEAPEEEFSSKFIQIIGKISLLAVVGLRSPFTCKLLAQGCLLLLEAYLHFSLYGSLFLQSQLWVVELSYFKSL